MTRLPCLVLPLVLAAAGARAESAQATLCRGNPALSPSIMKSVVAQQMQRDHDPSLDDESPDKLADEAVEQGVEDCAKDLSADPILYGELLGLPAGDRPIAWDAYNSACANSPAGSKGNCVKAEVDSQQALRLMVALNRPPGARGI